MLVAIGHMLQVTKHCMWARSRTRRYFFRRKFSPVPSNVHCLHGYRVLAKYYKKTNYVLHRDNITLTSTIIIVLSCQGEANAPHRHPPVSQYMRKSIRSIGPRISSGACKPRPYQLTSLHTTWNLGIISGTNTQSNEKNQRAAVRKR